MNQSAIAQVSVSVIATVNHVLKDNVSQDHAVTAAQTVLLAQRENAVSNVIALRSELRY